VPRSDPRRSRPTSQHARSVGLPKSIVAIAITSSQTCNRCWRSCGVPAWQTGSLDVLCLMPEVARFVSLWGECESLSTVSDGLGRLAALPESPAVIEFRTARTAHSFFSQEGSESAGT
jgi:hypothetical protein